MREAEPADRSGWAELGGKACRQGRSPGVWTGIEDPVWASGFGRRFLTRGRGLW